MIWLAVALLPLRTSGRYRLYCRRRRPKISHSLPKVGRRRDGALMSRREIVFEETVTSWNMIALEMMMRRRRRRAERAQGGLVPLDYGPPWCATL